MTRDTTSPVQRHYDTMLADVYAWMVGDNDTALDRARQDLHDIGPVRPGAVVVDLGAGLGLHARALADAGHATVWMLDTSAHLLSLAQETTDAVDARAVHGHLSAFREHVRPLPGRHDPVHGRHAGAPRGPVRRQQPPDRCRRIPAPGRRLRGDVSQPQPAVLWQRGDDGWSHQVSSYPKVRLDPEWVADTLRGSGLTVLVNEGQGGTSRVTARR